MLSGSQLDMIDKIAQAMRRSNEPFGGMQVAFSGDLFQLPPITRGNSRPDYITTSKAWNEADIAICYLESQYRQEDDEYLEILSEIRHNQISQETIEKLRDQISNPDDVPSDITRLYTHNVDVDELNQEKLSEIDSPIEIFEMTSTGSKRHIDALKRGSLAPELLELKVGAQVMFTKNDPAGEFVNGTQGEVVDFHNEVPVVKTHDENEIEAHRLTWHREIDGKVVAEISQVPLTLAWAITVHKSQGMTMDEAVIDLSGAFVPGQGYVALSRLKSLEGLHLLGLNDTALSVDPYISGLDDELQNRSQRTTRFLEKVPEEKITEHIERSIERLGGSIEEVDLDYRDSSTLEKTQSLLAEQRSITEISEIRDLQKRTIISHIYELAQGDEKMDLQYLKHDINNFPETYKAIEKVGYEKLKPIKTHLETQGLKTSYDDIALTRAIFVNKEI